MLSRLCSLAVVAFWLATATWLCYRDLWPALRPHEAPPFTIDLADEAQLQSSRIRWIVLRQDKGDAKRIGVARTWVKYRAADDTYELHSELENLQLGGGLVPVHVPKAASMYRVTRDGDLREMAAEVKAVVGVFQLQAEVTGEVRERKFWPRCRVDAGLLGKHDKVLSPVEVSAHGTVLNPLHPVNRIAGLRPGQRWRMPLVDPVADALAQELPTAKLGPRTLDAEVTPKDAAEQLTLEWHKQDVPVLVIEYRGDDMTARTWVRRSDGLVLSQEATSDSGRVILVRE